MIPLTHRQRRVLELINAFMDEQGVAPTRAELAKKLGFRSPNAAEGHLKALARKGYIELLPGYNRNIRLRVASLRQGQGIPLVGRVAAGKPILALENIEGCYHSADLFSPRADYLLLVEGMSMRDAGILAGDWLAVHSTPEARSGQIVVVRLDDEVTVKRLDARSRPVRLLPENPEFAPMEVDPTRHTLAIEGIVVGIIRKVI